MDSKTNLAKQDGGDLILATIPKGRNEVVRIAISYFKGKAYLALRIWFTSDDPDDDLLPSTKGINVPISLASDIVDGINRALAEARRRGLI